MNADLAGAALRLVGAPFRLHGRDPATGIDCVGVVAAALAGCGRKVHSPRGYSMRQVDLAVLLEFAALNGLVKSDSDGDVILCAVSSVQPHLVIPTRQGFVHAHASLGRVTEMPGPLPWPVICQWQLQSEKD